MLMKVQANVYFDPLACATICATSVKKEELRISIRSFSVSHGSPIVYLFLYKKKLSCFMMMRPSCEPAAELKCQESHGSHLDREIGGKGPWPRKIFDAALDTTTTVHDTKDGNSAFFLES